jgi:serine/threonine protein kinase
MLLSRNKSDQTNKGERTGTLGSSGNPPNEPPLKIGKYALHGEVGRGACGIVYKGFDPFVQRDVAIKVALPNSEILADKNEYERAFFAEARAAGLLTHPHIVSLFDAGAEGDLNYLVMEFIDGTTLTPFCRPSTRAPLEQVIDIVFKCAKALDYAHARGVLHRDIKPGNIMLTKDNVPKVMDFSIAAIGAQMHHPEDSPVGSPRYMSPEQIRGKGIGPTSDLYSLGTVLYQLLTGEAPFKVNDQQALYQEILRTPAPRADVLRPDLPKPLVEIVTRLLLKNPAERFQSGKELASELTRLFNQLRISGQQIARREAGDSLRRLNFFSTFSDEEIDEILRASNLSHYGSGVTFIKEGDIDHCFYIIVEGSAEVRKNNKTLSTLGKGSCIGEIGFLGSTKRTATVVAHTAVCALKVNAALMDQVSQECQLRFYKVFTETLIYRLSTTSAKLSAAS